MHFNRFSSHLEEGKWAPVYLFTGESQLLMEEAWNGLLEKIVPQNARRFNGERLDAKEYPAQEVLARLGMLTMFGKRRILMVENVDAWAKDQRKPIMAYLKSPSPAGCLVLTKSQKKGWEEITTAVDAVGVVVQFPAISERELPRWLQEKAKGMQKVLSPDAAVFVVEHVGTDLHRLEQELQKLAAYVGSRERITLEDAGEVVSWQRNFTVFELLDFVSRGQPGQAIASLRKLLLAGEPPLVVISLLARQIRILWQIKDGLDRGFKGPAIGAQLKLPGMVVNKYMAQASQFTQSRLYAMHRSLSEADLKMKTTATPPEWIIESLVVHISGTKQKSP